MDNKICISFFLLLLAMAKGMVYSQSYESISSEQFVKIMTPIVQKLNSDNIKVSYKKDIYQDINTKQLISSTSGYILHGKGLYYKNISEGFVEIQTNQLNVVIDSASSSVQISNPDTLYTHTNAITNFNVENMKKYELYMLNTNNVKQFKIITNNSSEGIIEYFISAKEQTLYKMIITYPRANYFSESIEDETLEEPFAVIIYEPIQELTQYEQNNSFNLDHILTPVSDKQFKLTDNYSQFKLYDSRYQFK